MATITPSEYAYLRDYIQDNPSKERERHLKKELTALLKLAKLAYILVDINELHESILMGNKEWDDWADSYIRDLRQALNRHIGEG
jgi:hypothetical protein